jgi:hypothetical protein
MTDEKKGTSEEVPNFHLMLARPERFERPTPWFVGKQTALSQSFTMMHRDIQNGLNTSFPSDLCIHACASSCMKMH